MYTFFQVAVALLCVFFFFFYFLLIYDHIYVWREGWGEVDDRQHLITFAIGKLYINDQEYTQNTLE